MRTVRWKVWLGLALLWAAGCVSPTPGNRIQYCCDQCGKAFGNAAYGPGPYGDVATGDHSIRQLVFCSRKCQTDYRAAHRPAPDKAAAGKPVPQVPVQEGDFVPGAPIACTAALDGYVLLSLRIEEENGVLKGYIRNSYPPYPKKEWNLHVALLDAQGRTVATLQKWTPNPGMRFDDWNPGEREYKDSFAMAQTEHGAPVRFRIEIESLAPSSPNPP